MNTKKLIIITTIVFLMIPLALEAQKKQPDEPITFGQVVWQIRKGSETVFKKMNYLELLELNDFIRINAKRDRKTFFRYLEGDRYLEGVVKSVVKGLFNRDPRVRLYCAHLLLKIAPKRKWLEKDIHRVIERETVDKFYFYTDIYGRIQHRNIREMVNKLLDIGYTLILLSPKPNLITYSKALDFEWSGVYGAESYDLYINDILYHRGKETLAPLVNLSITNRSSYGSYRWFVVAKDFNGRIITQNSGHFLIRKLQPSLLQISEQNPPKFKWNRINGADYYVLYIASKKNNGRVIRKLLYNGQKNYYSLGRKLAYGDYVCYLIAGNEFQRVISNKISLKIDAGRLRVIRHRRKKPERTTEEEMEDLDFDIDDFKDLEEDTIDEK